MLVYFQTCPIFIFNLPYFHFHYFFRIEFEKTHVAVRTLKQTKIPLAQPLIQPKTIVGSDPIILNPSNLNFNNSSSPPMVRNITVEETTAGTEISWEPPDEISDIKEKDRNRAPPVLGLFSRFGAKTFKILSIMLTLKKSYVLFNRDKIVGEVIDRLANCTILPFGIESLSDISIKSKGSFNSLFLPIQQISWKDQLERLRSWKLDAYKLYDYKILCLKV